MWCTARPFPDPLPTVFAGARTVRRPGLFSCGGCGWDRSPEKLKRQTACKPGSVPGGPGDGHSSGTRVAPRLARPTRAAARTQACGSPRAPPLFGLAPGGVCRAGPVAGPAVRSCRTVSPLPPGAGGMPVGVGGLVSVALSLGSPPPGVTRHRVSVEPGLSSPRGVAPVRKAAIRPSGSHKVRVRGRRVNRWNRRDRRPPGSAGRFRRQAFRRRASAGSGAGRRRAPGTSPHRRGR